MPKIAYIGPTKLLDAVTSTGAGSAYELDGRAHNHEKQTYQGVVVGTGAVSATVLIQVSNDETNWLTLGTITLSGTTSATDGFAADAAWVYRRANCTAISGTGATLTVTMGS